MQLWVHPDIEEKGQITGCSDKTLRRILMHVRSMFSSEDFKARSLRIGVVSNPVHCSTKSRVQTQSLGLQPRLQSPSCSSSRIKRLSKEISLSEGGSVGQTRSISTEFAAVHQKSESGSKGAEPGRPAGYVKYIKEISITQLLLDYICGAEFPEFRDAALRYTINNRVSILEDLRKIHAQNAKEYMVGVYDVPVSGSQIGDYIPSILRFFPSIHEMRQCIECYEDVLDGSLFVVCKRGCLAMYHAECQRSHLQCPQCKVPRGHHNLSMPTPVYVRPFPVTSDPAFISIESSRNNNVRSPLTGQKITKTGRLYRSLSLAGLFDRESKDTEERIVRIRALGSANGISSSTMSSVVDLAQQIQIHLTEAEKRYLAVNLGQLAEMATINRDREEDRRTLNANSLGP
ncbi:hypothetical protein BDK51DRAFT_43368 [Blyttiomyces helicus]|uniref:Uncharacterized protein n=1 Tax=Blyttiomyces helicus TaxID=388810 RepID=A0A4P9WNR1_9FUNG|nr:hypothetical protein BDK51DRAFT_43368 [Blyttiomyces helicus]|eukprot:RKO93925.1 hypothetical protein BDK51DRAFT_43368 [Blyttiomyces helicus]